MRHYSVNPALNVNGEHVGGIIGFLKGLSTLCRMLNPHEIGVVWEGGGSSRRRALYKNYKKNKKPPKLNRFYEENFDSDSNRINQVAFLTKVLKNLPIKQYYVPDCEADDVIGYIAQYSYVDKKVIIVSNDKDYYQLVCDRIYVWSANRKKIIKEADVIEFTGIHPKNFCIAKAITGDLSDNIDGVSGIGFKSLSKRLNLLKESKEAELELLFNQCEESSKNSKVQFYKKIVNNKELIKRNFKLMKLDVSNISGNQIKKINDIFDTGQTKFDKIELMRYLKRYGIKSFDPSSLFLSMNILMENYKNAKC